MAPPMCLPRSGVVMSSSLYRRRFSSVFSTPTPSRQTDVALDSSIAKIPLPGLVMFCCCDKKETKKKKKKKTESFCE